MGNTVGIVILNYKKWEETNECLLSLSGIDHDNYKIFVVDNCSENKSLDYIESWWEDKNKERLKIFSNNELIKTNTNYSFFTIQSNVNSGYASGNNLGIKLAVEQDCNYVLILNPDTTVTENFLTPMIEFLNKNNQVGLVGPKIMRTKSAVDYNCAKKRPVLWDYLIPTFIWRYYIKKGFKIKRHNPVLFSSDYYEDIQPKPVDIISGACMLIRSNVIEKVSFLDEKTFLYLEELILHEKLRKLDLLTYYIPESVIFHLGGSSTSLDSWLFIRREYFKSLRYYLKKYRKFNLIIIKIIFINVYIFQWFSLIKSSLKETTKK
jgi:GT2 family glycosyltransferase